MTNSNDNVTIPTWTIAKGIKWTTGIIFATFLIPWFSSHLADEEELIQGITAFIALAIFALRGDCLEKELRSISAPRRSRGIFPVPLLETAEARL